VAFSSVNFTFTFTLPTDLIQVAEAHETSQFVLFIMCYGGEQVEGDEMDRVSRMSG